MEFLQCEQFYALFFTDKGILMTFGNGMNGCLGHSDTKNVSEVSSSVTSLNNTILMVAVQYDFTMKVCVK